MNPRVTESQLLIERHIPDAQTELAEHRIIDADPARTYAATRSLDFLTIHTPTLAAAMWARGLPERLKGGAPEFPSMRLDDALDSGKMDLPGWVILGEDLDHEIAFGAIGRFWQPTIEWHPPTENFTDFDEPGWGKIAASFSLRPYGANRTLLTYDCRVAMTDEESRRKFQRYWSLVRPFAAHIFRATLATIAEDAARPDRRTDSK